MTRLCHNSNYKGTNPVGGSMPSVHNGISGGYSAMNEIILSKRCTKCQEIKTLSAFSKDKSKKDDLQCACKSCRAKQKRIYYKKNRNSILKKQKSYYQNNKQEIIGYRRIYYAENKQNIKEYKHTHYTKNKQKLNEIGRIYRKTHKSEGYELGRKWRKDNPDKVKIISQKATQKRRAIKQNAKIEDFNPFEVFERDNYICQLCGIRTRPDFKNRWHPKYPNLDHIIPLSKGGEHSKRNSQCLCSRCNHQKHNKTDFGDQMRLFG